MKHVIIAGGAGYVGGILAAALREHDVRVTVLSRRSNPERRRFDFQYKTMSRALAALKGARNGRDSCAD